MMYYISAMIMKGELAYDIDSDYSNTDRDIIRVNEDEQINTERYTCIGLPAYKLEDFLLFKK